MNNKRDARLRRARKTRLKIAELGVKRLTVHKSNEHIYAQIIDEQGLKVLVAASTLNKEITSSGSGGENIKNGGNIAAAEIIGEHIAKKALAAGIKQVAFDRSGFSYHGRIKALAESARKHGLTF